MAWTVAEVTQTLARHPSAVAMAPELVHRLPTLLVAALRFVRLQGVSDDQVVAVRRRHDHRPAVVAFCEIADTVARNMAALVSPDREARTPTPFSPLAAPRPPSSIPR
jgi:site-specific recombinase